MAGICFYFEDYDTDVWSGHDLDAWNYACKIAGDIDSAIIINKTEQTIQSFDRSMNIQIVNTLEEAQAIMSGEIMYMVCPWEVGNHTSILNNPHTANWYVLGPGDGWGNQAPDGVWIPQAGMGAVHSVHLITVLMFHRYWTLHH